MRFLIFLLFFFLLSIVQVHLREDHGQETSQLNQGFFRDLFDLDEDSSATLQREKRYSSRKKVLDDVDESEKPSRRTHSSKTNNRSRTSDQTDRLATTTTQESYLDEASLCINEFDVKNELLVKVKELKNGAHMIRLVRIEEPTTSHGLDVKDICMLNCCVEKYCDLAMLSEQRTNEGYKCYLFACNGSCTYAPHQDYTSMILKKDVIVEEDETAVVSNKQASKTNDKSSDASSTILSAACRSNEFSCRDGSCIPYYDVCNSYEDCPSGIDEARCSQEFTLHQRTQQESRKKPSVDVDLDANTDLDEALDEIGDEDPGTTIKSTSTKAPISKSKSKNREGNQQSKNLTSSYLYNIDLDTQERLSKLQKLKEHLEDTKGPEAWYHLFQTLMQHQKQEHTDIEPEQTASSSDNDDENFKDHLLALEQQWIADRQKTSTTTTTMTTTTTKPRVTSRKTTTTTTTKRMKIINDDDDLRGRRPPPIIEDEVTDDEEEDTAGDDNDRYYWQPAFDDRREGRYKYQQKSKSTSTTTTTTRKSRTRYPLRESSMSTLLRANGVDSDSNSHGRSFLRESSVILLLLLGLVFTIILLVLVGFYCRDSWKRGRILKTRSTDADYLINGLYL